MADTGLGKSGEPNKATQKKLRLALKNADPVDVQSVAIRCLLRILPVVAEGSPAVILAAYRAVLLPVLEASNKVSNAVANYAYAATNSPSSGEMREGAYAAKYVGKSAMSLARVMRVTDSLVDYTFDVVNDAALAESFVSDNPNCIWTAFRKDCEYLFESHPKHLSSQLLWPDEYGSPYWYSTAVKNLTHKLDLLGPEWPMLGIWYSLSEKFPSVGSLSQSLAAAFSTQENSFWDRDPETVMADIAILVGWSAVPNIEDVEQQSSRIVQFTETMDAPIDIAIRESAEDEDAVQDGLEQALRELGAPYAGNNSNYLGTAGAYFGPYMAALDMPSSDVRSFNLWRHGGKLRRALTADKYRRENKVMDEPPLPTDAGEILEEMVSLHNAYTAVDPVCLDLEKRERGPVELAEIKQIVAEMLEPLIMGLIEQAGVATEAVHDLLEDLRAQTVAVAQAQDPSLDADHVGQATIEVTEGYVIALLRKGLLYTSKTAVSGVISGTAFVTVQYIVSQAAGLNSLIDAFGGSHILHDIVAYIVRVAPSLF